MIEALHLRKRYGRHTVLRGFSLQAHPNEVTLLVGANGAGKTTSLRILAGLARPDDGEARICGFNLRQRRRAQARLSFLPQGVHFHPRLSCRHLLRFYSRLRRAGHKRVEERLELTGLHDEADKPAGKLSGGLRQRLGLAVLLLPDVPVLLLDEPGLSLDPHWRERLQSLVRHEAGRGRTILIATHMLAEWNGVADRCLLCDDGCITAELDPDNLRDSLSTRQLNRFAAA